MQVTKWNQAYKEWQATYTVVRKPAESTTMDQIQAQGLAGWVKQLKAQEKGAK